MIDFDLGSPPCRAGVQAWKMLMLLYQISIIQHLSLVFMTVMEVVANFCTKYLHLQVLSEEAYVAGDLGTSLQRSFLRMGEMMRGQRGWRELAVLGYKMEKVLGLIKGLIFTPKSVEVLNPREVH